MTTVVHFKPSADEKAESVSIDDGVSLLDGLLKQGFEIPFGCKGGVCQSCLLQSSSPEIPPQAQTGLTQAQIDQGLLMSCSCKPVDGMQVQHIDLRGQQSQLEVLEKSELSQDIFRLRVSNKGITYRAGQFMTLWRDEKIARSYSIASVNTLDEFMEFHIKRIAGGAFSDWAWETLSPGDTLQVQGPLGSCYYSEINLQAPILAAGIGTGLAPLIGIVRDALSRGHTGNISLFVGARNPENFYLVDELLALANAHKQLSVTFIYLESHEKNEETLSNENYFVQGDIYNTIKEQQPSLKDYQVYLCGAESFVRKLKKQCFLAGAGMKDIHADPFLPFSN